MSYLVLARKYRPRNFEEMVGQTHVVRALSNALEQRRLHHAYLFTGTRGVGKTTVSRILAKSLNCVGVDGQAAITARPCGMCQACVDIDAGRFVDYVELDAASNRGVEEISQLLEQAAYKPVLGRFKVYMIDEVHMLSNTAFNAMLKTLEEPPEYLKFVLATTDPQKVPVTVLSRCLQFNLRPIDVQTIEQHLLAVVEREGLAAEPKGLKVLARAANGSMRDALSLTDQAVAYGGGHISEAVVEQMLGVAGERHVLGLLSALAASSAARLIASVDHLRNQGLSAAGTLEALAELVRRLTVHQQAPQANAELWGESEEMSRLSGQFSAEVLHLLYSMALHGRAELGLAPDEYGALTMIALRMLAFMPPEGAAPAASPPLRETSTDPVSQTPVKDSSGLGRGDLQDIYKAVPPTSAREATAVPDAATRDQADGGAPADDSDRMERWCDLVQRMVAAELISALARELAWQAECLELDSGGAVAKVVLRVEQLSLSSDSNQDRLRAALSDALGRPVSLTLVVGVAKDNAAKRDIERKERLQRMAQQLIDGDPVVVAMRQQFKTAQIVPGSVRLM